MCVAEGRPTSESAKPSLLRKSNRCGGVTMWRGTVMPPLASDSTTRATQSSARTRPLVIQRRTERTADFGTLAVRSNLARSIGQASGTRNRHVRFGSCPMYTKCGQSRSPVMVGSSTTSPSLIETWARSAPLSRPSPSRPSRANHAARRLRRKSLAHSRSERGSRALMKKTSA